LSNGKVSRRYLESSGLSRVGSGREAIGRERTEYGDVGH
jgi:hypothetical protein